MSDAYRAATRTVLDELRARGCEVQPPGPDGEVRIRLPDGREAVGRGDTPDDAAIAAARDAERGLDPVQEGSEESFPASDTPSTSQQSGV